MPIPYPLSTYPQGQLKLVNPTFTKNTGEKINVYLLYATDIFIVTRYAALI